MKEKQMRTPWLQVIAVAIAVSIAVVVAGCTSTTVNEVSAEDLAEMRRAAGAYSKAWLSNDPEAVMATFVSQPVLSPSGLSFLEGQAAARGFWWPEGGPPTRVTKFEHEELEASGSGNVGHVRDTYTLDFEYDGNSHTNVSKFLHILERPPGGEWRISHLFWNDLPADERS